MTTQLELEVYRHLVAYLDRKESLKDFRRWFELHTWDQQQWESPLVSRIELALAELSSEHLTDGEFEESIRSSIPATLELPPIATANIPTNVTSASNAVKLVPAFSKPLPLPVVSEENPSRTSWQPRWQPQPAS